MANTAGTIESWQKYNIPVTREVPGVVADIVITWTHRDRTQQTSYIVEHSEGDIGPENGVTYTLEVYNDNNELVRSIPGISGTTYTYTEAMQNEDMTTASPLDTICIVLYSVRTGYNGESGGGRIPPESVLKDYFNTGDDVNPNCTYTDWSGFTFVADSSYTLTKIKLKLNRGASEVGSPYMSICNASGNYPVGGDLAYSTRPYTDVSLPPGSWLDFELNTPINIIQGNSYTIILHCAEDDPEGWDLLGWRADNDPGASYGVSICSNDSGASWFLGTYYGQGANLAYMFENWGY